MHPNGARRLLQKLRIDVSWSTLIYLFISMIVVFLVTDCRVVILTHFDNVKSDWKGDFVI